MVIKWLFFIGLVGNFIWSIYLRLIVILEFCVWLEILIVYMRYELKVFIFYLILYFIS